MIKVKGVYKKKQSYDFLLDCISVDIKWHYTLNETTLMLPKYTNPFVNVLDKGSGKLYPHLI